jgi:hypothetical protein
MTERRHNYLFKKMELYLKRETFTEESTIGKLNIDGQFECFILEDKDRGLVSTMTIQEITARKVFGKTCIPYGRYEIDWTMSARFKKMMPILLDTPGYTGIRIHVGNSEKDSLGCLLPGKKRANNMVTESTAATNLLYSKIQTAKSRGEKVFITIAK